MQDNYEYKNASQTTIDTLYTLYNEITKEVRLWVEKKTPTFEK